MTSPPPVGGGGYGGSFAAPSHLSQASQPMHSQGQGQSGSFQQGQYGQTSRGRAPEGDRSTSQGNQPPLWEGLGRMGAMWCVQLWYHIDTLLTFLTKSCRVTHVFCRYAGGAYDGYGLHQMYQQPQQAPMQGSGYYMQV